MPGRGVFRRPPTIRRRRFVPQTFAASRVIVRRWRRVTARRRFIPRRRPIVVVQTFAASPTLVVRARRAFWRARRRQILRRRPNVFGATAQATAGASPVRRPSARARKLVRVRRPRVVVGVASTSGFPVPGFAPPNVRHIRALVRQREARRRRQLWKPRPEEVVPVIGIPTGEETVVKGRIAQPGLVRGRIVSGGL